ncbi:MAG: TrkA family potassium uptake protein [Lentisphaerae bacterium]|nr:TrkA family potassium uptake protein [Lentisphaerota bacterium]
MRRRVAVLGAGRFGAALATALLERGVEVVVIDREPEAIQRLSSSVARAVAGDTTEVEVLREAGVETCDAAVVTISENMEGSILTTLLLKDMKIPHIVARAQNEIHGAVLERVGADRVVYPVSDMALRVARSLVSPTIEDYMEVCEGASVVDLKAPRQWTGKTLAQVRLPQEYGVTVLALRRAGGKKKAIVLVPSAEDLITAGDTLVVYGPDDKLRRLAEQS